jgi:hypothetical protein
MTYVEIPLTPVSQTFFIALGTIQYQLAVTWRGTIAGGDLDGWFLDISDQAGNALVQGIPLVTGADLLEQYAFLGIGNGAQLWVATDGDPSATPTSTNLGTLSHLYLVTN